MEEENLILKSWLEQEKIFIDNLLISRKRLTRDSVHDLRVAVKKLRSYLRLKKQLTGEGWKKSFLEITGLFQSFGRVGDFDNALTLIRQAERRESLLFPFFKEYLVVNRSLARKWAKKDAINFKEEKVEPLGKRLNITMTGAEISEKIIELSTVKIKKAKQLSKQFEKNAHKIRKQLKDIYYWIRILPKETGENFIDLKALDNMLSYLGSWQDCFVLRNKIKQYLTDLPKQNKERRSLKMVEKKLVSVQKQKLDNAIKKWEKVSIKKADQLVG